MSNPKSDPGRLPPISCFLGLPIIGLILCVYYWFVTYGTGNFFEYEWLSKAFDSTAKALLRGSVLADTKEIPTEIFWYKGKPTIYFGAFPAFLRMPLIYSFPDLWGKWPRLFCWLASFIALLSFFRLIRAATYQNMSFTETQRKVLEIFLLLGMGLGTPLLYLMSCAYIYHESILWGFAGSMTCLYFAWKISDAPREPQAKNYAWLSFFAGLTLISRLTYAIPFFLFLGVCFVNELNKTRRFLSDSRHNGTNYLDQPHQLRKILFGIIALILPALPFILFQAWHNHERFGSPLKFVDYSVYYPKHEWDFLLTHGGAMSFRRIPYNLLNYFSPLSWKFTTIPPFFNFIPIPHLSPALFPTHYREWVFSISISSLWLLLSSIGGFLLLLVNRSGGWLHRMLWFCFLPQTYIVLAYFFASQRYSMEFFPILCFSMFFLLRYLIKPMVSFVYWGLMATILLSIIVTPLSVFSSVADHNWGVQKQWRETIKAHLTGTTPQRA